MCQRPRGSESMLLLILRHVFFTLQPDLAIPFPVEPIGSWASTVARLQETRFQPSVHPQSHGRPEHRRQNAQHPYLQLCSAVLCRGHGVGDSRNLGMSVVRGLSVAAESLMAQNVGVTIGAEYVSAYVTAPLGVGPHRRRVPGSLRS